VQPFGACDADTRPGPYFRACDASAIVLAVHGVSAPDGAKFCASSITNSPPSGRLRAGFAFTQLKSAICSWVTKPCRCSSPGSPMKLITEIGHGALRRHEQDRRVDGLPVRRFRGGLQTGPA
jgi:hypothetical protein